jgi:hypothetical protein
VEGLVVGFVAVEIVRLVFENSVLLSASFSASKMVKKYEPKF